jgi:hypothetical protein
LFCLDLNEIARSWDQDHHTGRAESVSPGPVGLAGIQGVYFRDSEIALDCEFEPPERRILPVPAIRSELLDELELAIQGGSAERRCGPSDA